MPSALSGRFLPFSIITERQYGFGDFIRLSVPSLLDPAIGTVEDVTLRVTTVRPSANESGAQDQYATPVQDATPDCPSDHIVLLGSDGGPVSQRLRVPLAILGLGL